MPWTHLQIDTSSSALSVDYNDSADVMHLGEQNVIVLIQQQLDNLLQIEELDIVDYHFGVSLFLGFHRHHDFGCHSSCCPRSFAVILESVNVCNHRICVRFVHAAPGCYEACDMHQVFFFPSFRTDRQMDMG